MNKVIAIVIVFLLFSCSPVREVVKTEYVIIKDTCYLDLENLYIIQDTYKANAEKWNTKYDSIQWLTDIDLALYQLPEKEMNDTREFMRIRGRAIEWNTKYRVIEGIIKECQ